MSPRITAASPVTQPSVPTGWVQPGAGGAFPLQLLSCGADHTIAQTTVVAVHASAATATPPNQRSGVDGSPGCGRCRREIAPPRAATASSTADGVSTEAVDG